MISKWHIASLLSTQVCAIIFLCSGNLSSQWVQSVGPEGGSINCLTIDSKCIFIGTNVGFFSSTDNGSTWSADQFLSNKNIYFITALSNIVITGTSNNLFVSTNHGNTWSESNKGLPKYGCNCIAYNKSTIYAGTNEGVYYSNNFCSSWVKLDYPIINKKIKSISVSNSIIFLGTWESLLKSTDNGIHWTEDEDTKPEFITKSKNGEFIFISDQYECKKYTSDGSYLGAIYGYGINNFTCIVEKDSYYFFGTNGSVMRRNKVTTAWNRSDLIPESSSMDFYPTRCLGIKDNKIFAGTIYGLYVSDNDGINWNPVTIGSINSTINCLAVQDNDLYAGTNEGLYVSTNYGGSWQKLNTGLEKNSIYSLLFKDRYLITGTSIGLLFSMNKGQTWQRPNGIMGDRMWHIGINHLFQVDQKLFAGSSAHLADDFATSGFSHNGIYLSTNNGLDWVCINNGLTNKAILGLSYLNKKLFAATPIGIFVSSDLGSNWEKTGVGIPSSDMFQSITSMAVNDGNIFVGLTWGGIYRSSDFGYNWYEVNHGLKYDVLPTGVKCMYTSGKNIFIGTFWNGIYHSMDSGLSWIPIKEGVSNKNVRSIIVAAPYLIIGTDDNGVWRRKLADIITFTEQLQGNIIPKKTSISKIYQNLYDKTVKCEILLKNQEDVSLKVLDLNHRVVAELISEKLHPGSYLSAWNLMGINDGIYYFKLQVKNILQTRKFLIQNHLLK
jgi:photosystem II stability/assembly factor-like uncharacterized protein